MEQGLPRPRGDAPLPDQAGLLRQSHPAQVAQGEQTGVLQGLLGRKPKQNGNETRNCAMAEQKFLQFG